MATPPLLKRLNEETVLDTIRSGAPISRAEIARRAGISKPTVSLALRALLEAGLLPQAAHRPPGPPPRAPYFQPGAQAAPRPRVRPRARLPRRAGRGPSRASPAPPAARAG